MSFLAGKKKWIAFIIAVLANGLNDVLGLDLSAQTLEATTWVSGGYIAVEGALDLIRALNDRLKKTTVTVTTNPANEITYTSFKEAIPYLKTVHDGINKLLEDVKRDDGSEAFKTALQTYATIQTVIESSKHPEPVATIVEEQVSA